MGKLTDALSAAAKVAADHYAARKDRPQGERFVAGGRLVICPQCHSERFDSREALLNSTVLSLIDLDWLDESATALICVNCSAIRWFATKPEPHD